MVGGQREANVPAAAAWSLGQMGRSAQVSIPALEQALKSGDEELRTAAAEALERLRSAG